MRSIRNVSVAVVGGAGFLGSHLVNHLVEDRHCRVLVIDNLCVGKREFVHPDAEFYHADITGSEEHLRSIFQHRKIHYVFNYAACPYIPDSFARPIHVCNVNFMAAMKVINAAQESGCEAVLQVSSAEIYGGPDHQNVPTAEGCADVEWKINESAPVVPHSSYGAAKAAIDSWIQCAWRERKTPCIALRQFNCVGERETHPYVVPEIISQLSEFTGYEDDYRGQYVKPRRTGTPTVRLGNNSFRDFMYAGDAVRAAVLLLERGQFGEVYNLGSESGIKMYDLAKQIGKVMGFADVTVVEDAARKRPWEIWHLQSDNRKIVGAIGAEPTWTSFENVLRKAVGWFNVNGRKWPWE